MRCVRVISTGGRKSPVCRPPSPRFADIPTLSLPPLPPRDPLSSPVSRPISPSFSVIPPQSLSLFPPVISQDQSKSCVSQPVPEVQRPLSPSVLHVPCPESHSHLTQCDLSRSVCITPSRYRSAISDFRLKPYDLTGQITPDSMYVFACGGFGDIWKGSWWDGVDVHKVAVKVLRPRSEIDGRKTNKRLRREIEVWKRLVHENVVPLLGTAADFGPCIGMVSPWMDNGSLNSFLEKVTATLPVSDRIQLLCDVAAGLAYLHSNSVIHGDLTGANILIDSQGNARLVDFGLSTIKAEFEGTSYYSSTVGGALRWRAPELLSVSEDDVASNLSAACDIYSYGSVMTQVLSGKVPYHYLSELGVFHAVSKGIRPRRPVTPLVTDALWKFIHLCWHQTQSARPCVREVNDRVAALRHECMNPSPNVQQELVQIPFPVANRHLRTIIPSIDGYETDSESLRVLSPQTQASGFQSEQEGGTMRKRAANKSRIIRSSTLSLVNSVRSRKEIALPVTRTLNLRTLSSQRWKESINHEVSSLAKASHPNIRNIVAIKGSDLLCLSLEPILGMSLRDILRKSALTNNHVSGLCSKIVHGLQHLHQLGIIHGNLNSGNILLDTGGCVKLADFGLTAKVEREQSNRNEAIDGPYWSAPEFIRCGKYTSAMDIWSLGIVSIEMVEKQPPYFDKGPVIARQLIAAGGTPTLRDWRELPWELVRFLSACLVGNALERATASELCLHEFLADACSTMGLAPLLDVEMQRAY